MRTQGGGARDGAPLTPTVGRSTLHTFPHHPCISTVFVLSTFAMDIPENYASFLAALVGPLVYALIRVGVADKIKKLEEMVSKNHEDIIRIKAMQLKDD